MKSLKIFSLLRLCSFFLISINFYAQDICTNYTVNPGRDISGFSIWAISEDIPINVPESYILTDVNVTVNISHTNNADLDIYLISPTGTTVELSTDNGGNGNNYNNVTFDDASTNPLPTSNTTISGTYQPEGSLADFNGENANGNWVLRVIDDTRFTNGGTINSIMLNLCYAATSIGGYTGPGGVGNVGNSSNLVLWLAADSPGNSNTLWTDISGRGLHFNSGNGATLNSNDTNGYSSYSFNGSNQYFEKSYEAILNPDSFSILTASNVSPSGTYKTLLSSRDEFSTTTGPWWNPTTTLNTRGYILYATPTTNNWQFWTGENANSWQVADSGTSTTGSWALQNMFYQNPSNEKSLFIDNTTSVTNSQGMDANNTRGFRIGAGRNEQAADYFFSGQMSEIIMYNAVLNNAERIIVNNYLAAKYGLTLAAANDIYTMDNPGNGNFDHNVAGIGQASDGSNHTDSQGTGIVRINNPRNLNNNDFLFWGEETKNPTYNFTTSTANYTEQLNSRWRVGRRGNPDRVDISFDISGMDLSGKSGCSDLQLVIDDDGDFSSPEDIYSLTITGNTATATNVMFPQNSYFTLRYTDQIVWDGTNFFNGAGVGNAPDESNACLRFVVKAPGALTADAHVRSIEIEAGATLDVANGVRLEAENEVIINGTLNLLGEAQLIQNHTGASLNSGTGSLTARQQGTTNAFNYNYWSAPVNRGGNWQIGYLEDAAGIVNFTAAIDPPTTSPISLSSRWLYKFKGPSNDYNAWVQLSPTSNLSPGEGFTMKGSGAATTEQEFVFRGIPNDGTYNISVNAGTDFLTGNPYPSVLDANRFINDNSSVIDGTLYFWESFTTNNSHYLTDYEGGYAVYNLSGVSLPAVADASGLTSGNGAPSKPAPTQYINVGQGFFTTITNSGTLTFNNAQRAFARESLGETVYYKTSNAKDLADERPKIWFSFETPKGIIKTIGLGYDTNTTYGYDNGYDAKSYDNLKNDIYWSLENETLVIQALPNINIEDELPLGLKVSNIGLYKFSISKMENVPSDLNIYLLDKNQNIYYNLREAEAQLLLQTGNFDEYSIVFAQDQSLSTTPIETNTIFVSYNSTNKTLELHTKQQLTDIESYQIYNTLGQEVFSMEKPDSKTINISNLSNNVYFLKINSNNIKNSKSIKFVKH